MAADKLDVIRGLYPELSDTQINALGAYFDHTKTPSDSQKALDAVSGWLKGRPTAGVEYPTLDSMVADFERNGADGMRSAVNAAGRAAELAEKSALRAAARLGAKAIPGVAAAFALTEIVAPMEAAAAAYENGEISGEDVAAIAAYNSGYVAAGVGGLATGAAAELAASAIDPRFRPATIAETLSELSTALFGEGTTSSLPEQIAFEGFMDRVATNPEILTNSPDGQQMQASLQQMATLQAAIATEQAKPAPVMLGSYQVQLEAAQQQFYSQYEASRDNGGIAAPALDPRAQMLADAGFTPPTAGSIAGGEEIGQATSMAAAAQAQNNTRSAAEGRG